MNLPYTQTSFSIADLENISSINKATIRIWEKRYQLFDPMRSKTNIRQYTLDDLKKLLNISQLINLGYKISKIAQMSDGKVQQIIHRELSVSKRENYYIDHLLIHSFEYDRTELIKLYNELFDYYDFKEVYIKIIIPLLIRIGTLWQTNALDISHEHFLVHFLKEKVFKAIADLNYKPKHQKPLFILFLPENEIHELSLLFIHYLFLEKGFNTIMLGSSVPIDAIAKFKDDSSTLIFYTHLTNSLRRKELIHYFKDFEKVFSQSAHIKIWMSGSFFEGENKLFSSKIDHEYFNSIDKLEHKLNTLLHESTKDTTHQRTNSKSR